MVLDVERMSLRYGSQTSLWVKGDGNKDRVGLGNMPTINIKIIIDMDINIDIVIVDETLLQ